MAHQDYSQICPIFKEGVEHEWDLGVIPISSSLSTQTPIMRAPFGREVVLTEVFARQGDLSTTCYIPSISFSAQLFRLQNNISGSCSLCIGSIAHGSDSICLTAGLVYFSLVNSASCAFTSTDWIGLCITGVGDQLSTTKGTPRLVVRYRDK